MELSEKGHLAKVVDESPQIARLIIQPEQFRNVRLGSQSVVDFPKGVYLVKSTCLGKHRSTKRLTALWLYIFALMT